MTETPPKKILRYFLSQVSRKGSASPNCLHLQANGSPKGCCRCVWLVKRTSELNGTLTSPALPLYSRGNGSREKVSDFLKVIQSVAETPSLERILFLCLLACLFLNNLASFLGEKKRHSSLHGLEWESALNYVSGRASRRKACALESDSWVQTPAVP